MDDFWKLSGHMLRYRWLLFWAMVMATLSAAGLGAGIVGVGPVLDSVMGKETSLRQIVMELNATSLVSGRLPTSFIDQFPEETFASVVWIMIGLGLLTVFGATANFLHTFFAVTVVQRTIAQLRRELFRRVVHLPLRKIAEGGSADVISRIVNDPQSLALGMTALVSKSIAQMTKGIAALIAAFVVDWRLTGIALIVAPLLYTIIRKLGKRIRRASRAALQSQALLYGATAEVVQGLRVVKVHANERQECGRFHVINKKVLRELLRVRFARALASPLVEVVSIVTLGVLSLVAIKAIQDGQLDSAKFVLAIGALGVAGASLKPLTGLVTDIQQSSAAAARIKQLLDEMPEERDGSKRSKLQRHTREIEFENVSMTYHGALKPALQSISLHIRHGRTVAFVGPNGCGKTTLLSLVPRLFDPNEGVVRIDGTDVRDVGLRSLRSQIGVVTQETVLFRQSVRQNIAYGARGVDDAMIMLAAKRARAHEFIIKLPQGYDTVLGDQGMTLSGGQRQRLAIARAILRDPAILIFDEATSMIDTESESHIAAALADFAQGRTCLIVAHRLSTVVNADEIVVMDHGSIVDRGTHADLIGRCTLYQQLARH